MKPMKSIAKIKNDKPGEWIGILLLLLCAVLAAVSVRLCFSSDIWYDELFTMGLSGHSFEELISFTARDVHPPFYYMYVKIVQELCKLFAANINLVIVSKVCSVIPFLLLLTYAATKVRKHFGLLTAGVFSFCLFTMPQLSQYTTEIRMYSLSLFLVTAAFLHSYEIACGKRRDWIYLTIYGILAAYTHYFAGAAIGMIYLYLLVWFVRSGGLKPVFKKWLLCVAVSVFAYIPWMFAVIGQVSQVKENYWILPLTWRSIGGCVKFLLKPSFADDRWNVIAAVALFCIYAGLVLYSLWKGFRGDNRWIEQKDRIGRETDLQEDVGRENVFAAAGVFVLLGLAAFGFAASFLIRPVFIYRYMLPAMGCFWLCFSIFFSRFVSKKAIFVPVFLLLVVIGITDYRSFFGEETWKREQMELTVKELEKVSSEDIVIFNFNHVQGILGYYLADNETYLWMEEPEALIREMFGNRYGVMSTEEIKSWLREGRKVWFAGSGNAREELLAEWEKEGLAAEEEASCLIERYWFNLYLINMEK